MAMKLAAFIRLILAKCQYFLMTSKIERDMSLCRPLENTAVFSPIDVGRLRFREEIDTS